LSNVIDTAQKTNKRLRAVEDGSPHHLDSDGGGFNEPAAARHDPYSRTDISARHLGRKRPVRL